MRDTQKTLLDHSLARKGISGNATKSQNQKIPGKALIQVCVSNTQSLEISWIHMVGMIPLQSQTV